MPEVTVAASVTVAAILSNCDQLALRYVGLGCSVAFAELGLSDFLVDDNL